MTDVMFLLGLLFHAFACKEEEINGVWVVDCTTSGQIADVKKGTMPIRFIGGFETVIKINEVEAQGAITLENIAIECQKITINNVERDDPIIYRDEKSRCFFGDTITLIAKSKQVNSPIGIPRFSSTMLANVVLMNGIWKFKNPQSIIENIHLIDSELTFSTSIKEIIFGKVTTETNSKVSITHAMTMQITVADSVIENFYGEGNQWNIVSNGLSITNAEVKGTYTFKGDVSFTGSVTMQDRLTMNGCEITTSSGQLSNLFVDGTGVFIIGNSMQFGTDQLQFSGEGIIVEPPEGHPVPMICTGCTIRGTNIDITGTAISNGGLEIKEGFTTDATELSLSKFIFSKTTADTTEVSYTINGLRYLSVTNKKIAIKAISGDVSSLDIVTAGCETTVEVDAVYENMIIDVSGSEGKVIIVGNEHSGLCNVTVNSVDQGSVKLSSMTDVSMHYNAESTIEVENCQHLTVTSVTGLPKMSNVASLTIDQSTMVLDGSDSGAQFGNLKKIIRSVISVNDPPAVQMWIESLACDSMSFDQQLVITGTSDNNYITKMSLDGTSVLFSGVTLQIDEIVTEQEEASISVSGNGRVTVGHVNQKLHATSNDNACCVFTGTHNTGQKFTLSGNGCFSLRIGEFSANFVEISEGSCPSIELVDLVTYDFTFTENIGKALSFVDCNQVSIKGNIENVDVLFSNTNVNWEIGSKSVGVFSLMSAVFTGQNDDVITCDELAVAGRVNIGHADVIVKNKLRVGKDSTVSNSVYMESCSITFGQSAAGAVQMDTHTTSIFEMNDDNGVPVSFSFYGRVTLTENYEYRLGKNQFFFSEAVFKENVNLNSRIGPMVRSDTELYCGNGYMSYSEHVFKCAYEDESGSITDDVLSAHWMCEDGDGLAFSSGHITCSSGTLVEKEEFTNVAEYPDKSVVLVGDSVYDGTTYSYDMVNLSIVNPGADHPVLITAKASNTEFLAKGYNIQQLTLEEGSTCSAYVTAFGTDTVIGITDSQLYLMYDSDEVVDINSITMLNSALGVSGTATDVIQMTFGTVGLTNSGISGVHMILKQTLTVSGAFKISDANIVIDQGCISTFTDASVTSVGDGVIINDGEIQFKGTLEMQATVKSVNPESVVKFELGTSEHVDLSGFSLNCSVICGDLTSISLGGEKDVYIGPSLAFESGKQLCVTVTKYVVFDRIEIIQDVTLDGGILHLINMDEITQTIDGTGTIWVGNAVFQKGITLSDGGLWFDDSIKFMETVRITKGLAINATESASIEFDKSVELIECSAISLLPVKMSCVQCKMTSEGDANGVLCTWKNVSLICQEFTIDKMLEVDMNLFPLEIKVTGNLDNGHIYGVSQLLFADNSNIHVENGTIDAEMCRFMNVVMNNDIYRFACNAVQFQGNLPRGELQLHGVNDIVDSYFNIISKDVTLSFVNNGPNIHIFGGIDFQLENDWGGITWTQKPNMMPKIGSDSRYLHKFNEYDFVIAYSKCPSGYAYQKSSGMCIVCSPRYYGSGEECIPCGIGYYSDDYGLGQCKKCPLNTFANTTGTKHCYVCPKEMATVETGGTSESQCVCKSGYAMDADGSCHLCEEGYDCSNVGTEMKDRHAMKGYWQDGDKIYKCRNQNACLGADQCGDRYTGFLCSKCQHGYYSVANGVCSTGTFGNAGWIIILSMIILVGLIYLSVFVGWRYFAHMFLIFQQFTQMIMLIGTLSLAFSEQQRSVFMIFEFLNLDFRRVFQSMSEDGSGIWLQGILYLVVNLLTAAVAAIRIAVYTRKLKTDKQTDKPNDGCTPSEQPRQDNNQNNDVDGDDLAPLLDTFMSDIGARIDKKPNNTNNASKQSAEHTKNKLSTTINIYVYFSLLLAGAQMSWFMTVVHREDGRIVGYEYLETAGGEWMDWLWLIIINGVFCFAPVIAMIVMIVLFKKQLPMLEFYRYFGYIASHYKFGKYTWMCYMDYISMVFIYSLMMISTDPNMIRIICVMLSAVALIRILITCFHRILHTRFASCLAGMQLMFTLVSVFVMDSTEAGKIGGFILYVVACIVVFIVLIVFVWFERGQYSLQEKKRFYNSAKFSGLSQLDPYELECLEKHPLIDFLVKKRNFTHALDCILSETDNKQLKNVQKFRDLMTMLKDEFDWTKIQPKADEFYEQLRYIINEWRRNCDTGKDDRECQSKLAEYLHAIHGPLRLWNPNGKKSFTSVYDAGGSISIIKATHHFRNMYNNLPENRQIRRGTLLVPRTGHRAEKKEGEIDPQAPRIRIEFNHCFVNAVTVQAEGTITTVQNPSDTGRTVREETTKLGNSWKVFYYDARSNDKWILRETKTELPTTMVELWYPCDGKTVLSIDLTKFDVICDIWKL